MIASRSLEAPFSLLRRCIEDGLVPGAVAAAGTAGGTLGRAAFGSAQTVPLARPLREDALFDVASLTKIVVTVTVCLRLLERGDLHLDQRVASVLPEFGAAGKDAITIRHLMTHTSGLPAWTNLHARGATRQDALRAVCAAPLERPVGSSVVYSDLGFITLGAVLQQVADQPLDKLAAQEVFRPLGMHDSRYRPSQKDRKRCVTTEVQEERGGAVTGVVHDENAEAMGGVSGHAGLFTTCADLELFCRAWLGAGQLDGTRLLSPATVRAATREQTAFAGPVARERRRGLGWVLQPNPLWVPADLCSPQAYSHTGFTGTSLLIDPEAGLFAVLLTNRVHPTREGGSAERIRSVRARFHNAVWAALG